MFPCVCRRFSSVAPANALVLNALAMEVELVSTSSGIPARRQRGSDGRARVAPRRGQGSLARMWAGGCAHRSGMCVRAARALCIALQNLHFAPIGPIGPKRGPIASTVCRARKMRKVYWHITFYTKRHSSGFKVSNVDFDVAYTPH